MDVLLAEKMGCFTMFKARRWRKSKTHTKVHSGTFYLSQDILKALDIIARIENQSRSVIVECALVFQRAKYDWDKCKKRTYKKPKKIPASQRNPKGHCKKKQREAFKQECLFATSDSNSNRTICE